MRVVKHIFLVLNEDIKTYVFPFLWQCSKWAVAVVVAVLSIWLLDSGYKQLGASVHTSALLSALTFVGLAAVGEWVRHACKRAKEKVRVQNQELLNTISGTTQTKPDVDNYIRRVKYPSKGKTL